MVSWALWLLSAALVIGVVIGLRFASGRRLPSRAIGAVHGLLGVSGLAVLIFAFVNGVAASDKYGAASFGPASAALGVLAVLAGAGIAVLGRSSTRGIGLLIAIHASLAVTAYVLLLAFDLLALT
jgi:hypothetical protein